MERIVRHFEDQLAGTCRQEGTWYRLVPTFQVLSSPTHIRRSYILVTPICPKDKGIDFCQPLLYYHNESSIMTHCGENSCGQSILFT